MGMVSNKYTSWFSLSGLVVAVFASIWILWPKDDISPYTPLITRPSPVFDQPDPCGLEDVVCPNEKVITATVYSYQAVSDQTDSSPCTGAMPGINFCNPPYLIVANNCLKLGTRVSINSKVYTVADRMAKRHGCDVFDRLTSGKVTLHKQEVFVLP